MQAKKVSESKTNMTEMVMPNDTNPMGNLMGGNLMKWMDIVAAICAGRHCQAQVVTVSVDHVSFQKPISQGDIVTIDAAGTMTHVAAAIVDKKGDYILALKKKVVL